MRQTYVTEGRYPLPLASAMPDVWELWRRAKTLEWDPQTDIPWEDLHPERYSAEQRLAAQMYWSRRTWGEYGAISESPALLLRFCLERRLPDLQFFFTMRTLASSVRRSGVTRREGVVIRCPACTCSAKARRWSPLSASGRCWER